MPSETLAQYEARVRNWVHERNPATSRWGSDFIRTIFNSNYRRRCAQLVMAFEGYFIMVATNDIVAAQARYAWPDGFERLFKMELVRSDGTTVPIHRAERHRDSNPTGITGADAYYPSWRPIGAGFVLEPAPIEAMTGGLKIEFYGTPPKLEGDDDRLHSDFPVSFDELLVLDTAVSCFDQEGLLESGVARTILRQRAEFEIDFARYIDARMTSRDSIEPFICAWPDS
jgi:hypothetical protein